MMPYWLRIAVGALLGIVAGVALWLFVGAPWLTASVAGLLAAIGFLATYFLWSADRPQDGYEQVLFDRPNTIVSAMLIVVLALAGVGSGFVGRSGAPPTPAEAVTSLYASYVGTSDAYAKKESDVATTTSALDAMSAQSDALAQQIQAMPESPERASLQAANDALSMAVAAMKACVEGENAKCLDARLAAADAQSALTKAQAA